MGSTHLCEEAGDGKRARAGGELPARDRRLANIVEEYATEALPLKCDELGHGSFQLARGVPPFEVGDYVRSGAFARQSAATCRAFRRGSCMRGARDIALFWRT